VNQLGRLAYSGGVSLFALYQIHYRLPASNSEKGTSDGEQKDKHEMDFRGGGGCDQD